MLPVQNLAVEALLGVAILIAVFGHCHGQAVGRDTAVVGRSCGQGRLYFPQTGKCYRSMDNKGPCGELMKFVPSAENKTIGKCECLKPNIRSKDAPARPLVFVERYSRCYPIYHQGPCGYGNWLVVETGNVGVCERIPCPEKYYTESLCKPTDLPNGESTFLFAIRGKCVTTGDRCSVKNSAKQVYLNGLSFDPVCVNVLRESSPASGTVTVGNSCGDGTNEDNFGGCELQTLF